MTSRVFVLVFGVVLPAVAGWPAAHAAGGKASAEGEKPADAVKRVSVALVLSEREYDPAKPSKGVIKCVVRNGTAETVDVPVGYDGTDVQLDSGILTLRQVVPRRGEAPPKPKTEGYAKTVQLGPGKEQVVFQLPLDEILLKSEGSDKLWHWDWPRRPEPPHSPVHRWRKSGFNDQATFVAKILVGRQTVKSDAVVLKVRVSGSAK